MTLKKDIRAPTSASTLELGERRRTSWPEEVDANTNRAPCSETKVPPRSALQAGRQTWLAFRVLLFLWLHADHFLSIGWSCFGCLDHPKHGDTTHPTDEKPKMIGGRVGQQKQPDPATTNV